LAPLPLQSASTLHSENGDLVHQKGQSPSTSHKVCEPVQVPPDDGVVVVVVVVVVVAVVVVVVDVVVAGVVLKNEGRKS
jgi:hypothetical protein